jgi:hypothetical protein
MYPITTLTIRGLTKNTKIASRHAQPFLQDVYAWLLFTNEVNNAVRNSVELPCAMDSFLLNKLFPQLTCGGLLTRVVCSFPRGAVTLQS